MIYLCTAGLKSKPEETTILRSRSVIFVSRWGWHEGSTNCSVCVFVALLNTTFCLHVVYQPRRPFSCQRKQSSARLTTWLTHGSTHIIFTSLPDYFELFVQLTRINLESSNSSFTNLAIKIRQFHVFEDFFPWIYLKKDRKCTTTVNALQSNLDYPDFSIIRTFSWVPSFSCIIIRHDQDP